MLPPIKGNSRFSAKLKLGSPSDRNFMIPGGLTLDTDSELDNSKMQIREKLKNNNTTRNIRNKTIDIPGNVGAEFHSPKKQGHARSNMGKLGSARYHVGQKKHSLPQSSNILNSPTQESSKPTLFVDNSDMNLNSQDHGNRTLDI